MAAYNKHPDKMPGPNAPDPKVKPGGVLGKGPAYAIPGLGQYGEAKNNAAYRKKHAFNPGGNPTNTRYS